MVAKKKHTKNQAKKISDKPNYFVHALIYDFLKAQSKTVQEKEMFFSVSCGTHNTLFSLHLSAVFWNEQLCNWVTLFIITNGGKKEKQNSM